MHSQRDSDTEMPFVCLKNFILLLYSILLSHFPLMSAGIGKNIWIILSILTHFSILNKFVRLLFIRWLECMHMNCFEIWEKSVKFYAQVFLNQSSVPKHCSYWTSRRILTVDFDESRINSLREYRPVSKVCL